MNHAVYFGDDGAVYDPIARATEPIIEDENPNPDEVTDDGLGVALPDPFTADEVGEAGEDDPNAQEQLIVNDRED